MNQLPLREHIVNMLRLGTWATDLEVIAAATYFQILIYFCEDPPPANCDAYCW